MILLYFNINIKEWLNLILYINVKLSNSQLNMLKSGIKNETEVTFHHSLTKF